METSPSTYDPLLSSYVQISVKNRHQNLQKWCHLNFNDGFEFGNLENPRSAVSSESNEFDKLTQKTVHTEGILEIYIFKNFRKSALSTCKIWQETQ